jgi:hypothetical protein
MSQIPLTKYNVTNLTNNVSVTTLFDNDLNTVFFPGFGAEYYPCRVLIDLNTPYDLYAFSYYDSNNAQPLNFYTSMDSPFNTTLFTSITQSGFNVWRVIPFNTTARFIILEFPNAGAATTPEIKFSGTTTGASFSYSSTTLTSKKIRNYINTNAFHWVNNDILNNFDFVREFQEWVWMENIEGINTFDPSWSGAGHFDTHYNAMKRCGVNILPVIQGSPNWMNKESSVTWNDQWKPLTSQTLNAELPANYIQSARFAWQFGARYGRVSYPISSLTINTTPFYTGAKPNEYLSGSDLIQYVEFWNEPEKTWKQREGRFTAFEYAAYISAIADGHCGTMGPYLGVKTADPSMKLVCAGMYDDHFEFLKAMLVWFRYNRLDGQAPFDIVNFHHYSNSTGGQFVDGSIGISPEANQIVTSMTEFVHDCKVMLPNHPVWITEFGYDSNNNSLQKVPSITGQTQFETQANLVLRSILEYSKVQIDKTFVFNIYDENVNQSGATTYMSCGLVVQESLGWKPKPNFNFVIGLRNLMADFMYLKDNSTGNTRIYKYNNEDGDFIYAFWSPTSNNTSFNSFITIEEQNVTPTLYRLIDVKSIFIGEKQQLVNNQINVNVSEAPKFILVQNTSRLNTLYPIKIKNKKFF